ncbi:protein NODULATION SIGNALING PATHWAY 2-like [Populus alba x Populus x berolinensis]|uniref:Protein NODULATION SIGNALING PATHWAY 2-like n=1 Tax=Populus alba x Populus x berolinensis TaxID=444605 RepID=A0AAD6LKS7_9ROSI|nr:protein NODULATION SIGNALING PATHWAY 2-like [Populus alba x Populus x berolinensis]
MDTTPIPQSTLELPGEELQLENQVSLFHLLKAYGEAMDGGQSELADVIMRCVSERVSPAGEALECLAFNLCHDLEKQGDDYIKRESCRNFELAFMAFYQLFPYGRFAHFAANSAILEALPADAETIHIVDFDLGEGIQWPPLIEDLAHLQKAVRLTAIKWKKDDCNWAPMVWSFDAAKRRLLDLARCFGLNLKKWVEMKQGCNLELGNVFEGWRVSRVSLEEAREVVGDEQSSYGVRIGGDLGNEMILQWKSTPLVRVSTWRK